MLVMVSTNTYMDRRPCSIKHNAAELQDLLSFTPVGSYFLLLLGAEHIPTKIPKIPYEFILAVK